MIPVIIGAVVVVGIVGSIFWYANSSGCKTNKKKKSSIERIYLYHYTTEAGARGIRKDRRLKVSKAALQDAVFGDGVYLTSLHPKEGKSRIIANNYDDKNPAFVSQFPSFANKANYFFRFLSTDLPGVHRTTYDRDVWRYPRDINLDNVDHIVGETEKSAMMKKDQYGTLQSISFV